MRCGLVRCPGEKSNRFSIIPVVSFSHVHAISSRVHFNSTDLPSGRWVPILRHNILDIKENNQHDFEIRKTQEGFFYVDLHSIDCRLVSGSYVNKQVSSQVIIEINKSGSFSMRCKCSKFNSLRRSFCSSDSS